MFYLLNKKNAIKIFFYLIAVCLIVFRLDAQDVDDKSQDVISTDIKKNEQKSNTNANEKIKKEKNIKNTNTNKNKKDLKDKKDKVKKDKKGNKKDKVEKKNIVKEKDVNESNISEIRGEKLLSIDEDYKYLRIPGLKIEKYKGGDANVNIVDAKDVNASNIDIEEKKSLSEKKGLLGMSKDKSDIVAKISLVFFIVFIFILYRVRNKRSNRSVLRSVLK